MNNAPVAIAGTAGPRSAPASRVRVSGTVGQTATHRGYCSWDVDHAGWAVTLHSPDEQDFYGKTLEEALAWCLVWLMSPELGVGPYLV